MIYAYKPGSNSAKLLKDKIQMKMIKHQSSNFKGGSHKTVINWGASEVPEEVSKCRILNKPEAVKVASNKKTFFNAVVASDLAGNVNIPEFTTDKEVAKGWLDNEKKVVIREKLSGHSAEGLVLIEDEQEWDNYNHSKARLYVLYIPKKDEYRVHVVRGKAVDVRRKALRSDFPKNAVNWQVRNHGNGFIYQKKGFTPQKEVIEQAIMALAVTDLDFGAVDVIWNNYHKKAFVLEINTAPGLEGSTVDNYAAAFEEILPPETDLTSKYMKAKKGLASWDEIFTADPTALFPNPGSPVVELPSLSVVGEDYF